MTTAHPSPAVHPFTDRDLETFSNVVGARLLVEKYRDLREQHATESAALRAELLQARAQHHVDEHVAEVSRRLLALATQVTGSVRAELEVANAQLGVARAVIGNTLAYIRRSGVESDVASNLVKQWEDFLAGRDLDIDEAMVRKELQLVRAELRQAADQRDGLQKVQDEFIRAAREWRVRAEAAEAALAEADERSYNEACEHSERE